MVKATTINWDQLRTEYVTGELSLRDLAKKYGISPRQVYEHSRGEGWVAQRKQFRSKTAAEAQKLAQAEAAEGAALIFKIAKLLLEKFYAALQADGIELSPHHAAQWAHILLALEEAGRAAEAQQIIVKWVADEGEGDQDCLQSPPEAEDVP